MQFSDVLIADFEQLNTDYFLNVKPIATLSSDQQKFLRFHFLEKASLSHCHGTLSLA